MATEEIAVASAEGVATITLNRPDALNAFPPQLHRELADALKQAERDAAVRALVITGAGRAFRAGQDLKALGEIPPLGESMGLDRLLRSTYNPLILRLRSIEKPIIAAVNGVAAGAGFSLALACDLRVAADSATFTLAFNRIGLVPDSGAMYFLPQLIGVGRALELAWTSRSLSAQDALAPGLVTRVVPRDSVLAGAQALAAARARGAGKALGLTKRGMSRGLTADLETMLDYEADLQEVASRTTDFREGVAAFKEKRPPGFTGA